MKTLAAGAAGLLVHREHGGTNELSNLTALCESHHLAHHEGTLVIERVGGELTGGGNGLVEMGTYVAILGGTLLGGVLVAQAGWGVPAVALTIVIEMPTQPAVNQLLATQRAWRVVGPSPSARTEATLAAADRALAADPNDVHALIYKGRVLVELAKKDRSKADWKQIRSLFIKANRIENENAEPLLLYYKSFLDAGQRPTVDSIRTDALGTRSLAPRAAGAVFRGKSAGRDEFSTEFPGNSHFRPLANRRAD